MLRVRGFQHRAICKVAIFFARERWHTMLRSVLLALVLLAFTGAVVFAEEIHLKDGTKITGKILGVKGDVFQVKTSYGEIQVPRSDIVSINFPENQPKAADDEESEPAPVDEVLEGTQYTNRTAKFRMTIPEGWVLFPELRKNAKDVVAALASKDKTLLFMVTPEAFTGSLNSFKGLAEMQYQTSFGDYQKLSESEITLDGRKGIRLTWKAVNKQANNAPMKSLVVILPYEGRIVRLSFLTVGPLYDEAVATVEKMIMTYATLPL